MRKPIDVGVDFDYIASMRSAIFLIIFLPGICFSQDFGTRSRQLFAMNVLTSGVIGGIGSAINKKEGETRGKAFVNGFWKGCIGGSLIFTGKLMTYQITREHNFAYGWPSKITHSLGASILENAARNNPLLYNFAIDFGPARFDINRNGKAYIRLQPFATLGMLANFIKGNTLDIKKSFIIGTPSFYYDYGPFHQTDAYTIVNSITINRFRFINNGSDNRYNTSAHEFIHCFQFREYLAINSYYLPNKNKYIYWDVPIFSFPYLFFYRENDYYSNPFEYEAETLSHRKFNFNK